MKRGLPLFLAVAFVLVGTLAFAKGPKWWKGTLTVANDSDYDVHHIYFAPAHVPKWGKDWLGKKVLHHGEMLTITGLDCDEYDIKLIDEDGDVCIVEDANICHEDALWHLTSRELEACAGWH